MRTRYFLLIFCCLLLGSCKSRKKVVVSPPPPDVMEELYSHDLDFNYLKVNSALAFEDENQKVKAQLSIRMRKDSLIWMSIRVAILEVARVILTQDSVFMMDRLKREYHAQSYSFLEQRLGAPVTFDWMQALLIGQTQHLKGKKFTSAIIEDAFILTNETEDLRIEVQPHVDVPKVGSYYLKAKQKEAALKANFLEYQGEGQAIFPLLTSYIIENPQFAKAELKHGKFTLTNELSFPFKIPSSYKQLR